MAPTLLGGAGAADISDAMTSLDSSVSLKSIELKEFDGDIRLTGRLH